MSDHPKIQCHFISNTHWDREWRYSAQRTRFMLCYLLDMLFDIFEKEPNFKYFHLDSQTMPIQDYLEIYPEKAILVEKYVREGKLIIGPWFCLPDEFSVSGESLVRNLLLGHEMARKFGCVNKTGYSPFGWGQVSQMPQIYSGFGIDVTSFYRGINTYVAPKSEFIWESPDGSRVIGSRLGARPRYNVWYVIQRPVYWGQENENNRKINWNNGNGPFRFVDAEKCDIDYQYTHPVFGYLMENVPARAEQAIREQDNDWTTPHRFWSAGHDSSCPDIREVRLIADCQKALKGKAEVFHSTVKAWQEGLKANIQPDWPLAKGEMRHPYTKGSTSGLFGAVISARTYIKQDNFRSERQITQYAEPLAVFASLLGAPYPRQHIKLAYNYLLQNHGHDSIGACGRDIIYEDVLYRFRQSREISACVLERAMMDICGDIDLSSWETGEMALVVFNPSPFTRSEVMTLVLEIPTEWACAGFEIVAVTGEKIPVQFCEKISPFYLVIQSPNDTANTISSTRYSLRAKFTDLPAMGYKTFSVKPVKTLGMQKKWSMVTAAQTMENETLKVTLHSNGTFDLEDKENHKVYQSFGYFKDTGEIGNPWEHISPQADTTYTTLNECAKIVLVQDGELETTFKVTIDWRLPESRSADERSRSNHLKAIKIDSLITLRKGQRWVDITTEIDNTVEDHYLQAAFPVGIHTDDVWVQGQFDVLKRPTARLDASKFDEVVMTEHPMNSFVDINNDAVGVAFLNEGLKAYEVGDDSLQTLYLTLFRAFPLRICVTSEMTDYSQLDKGSQCPGKNRYHYAVLPHAGGGAEAKIWQQAEQFTIGLQAAQIAPTRHGKEPLCKSFLELREEGLHISAVKQSESGAGFVVRLFNPLDISIKNAIRLNSGFVSAAQCQTPVERLEQEFELPKEMKAWSQVRRVTLEELPAYSLEMDGQGWVEFEIGQKQILTLEFIP